MKSQSLVFLSFSFGLLHHSDDMLLLLRHHGNASWFAVFANIPLPEK